MSTRTKILLTSFLLLIGLSATQAPNITNAISNERAQSTTKEQQDLIENKKAALKQQLLSEKENQIEKLESKRLEICKTHEQKINNINRNNIDQNSKQLETFLKIENNTKKFYEGEGLLADGYEDAIISAEAKYVEAKATIEASGEVSFNCDTANSKNPGGTVRTMTTTRHTALKDYKTAVKDLITIVKNANTEKVNQNESTTSTENR